MAPESEHLARLPLFFSNFSALIQAPLSPKINSEAERRRAAQPPGCVFSVSKQWVIIGRDAVNVFRNI